MQNGNQKRQPEAAIETATRSGKKGASRGLSRRDLEQFIGGRGRVSEILNRKRPLTIGMIRKLHAGLGIPAEVLIQPYSSEESAA